MQDKKAESYTTPDDLARAAKWLIQFTCRQDQYRENYEKGWSTCVDIFTALDQQQLADLFAEVRHAGK